MFVLHRVSGSQLGQWLTREAEHPGSRDRVPPRRAEGNLFLTLGCKLCPAPGETDVTSPLLFFLEEDEGVAEPDSGADVAG